MTKGQASCFFFFLTYSYFSEPSSSYTLFQPKVPLKAPESVQKRISDLDSSSEEQVGTGSPSPVLRSTGTPSSHQHKSLSSQESKPTVAKVTQSSADGIQQLLDRAKMASTVSSVASHKPDPNISLDPPPPALPPKTRKAKVVEPPKDHSDWGDSDMDEETYSGSQDKAKGKKV